MAAAGKASAASSRFTYEIVCLECGDTIPPYAPVQFGGCAKCAERGVIVNHSVRWNFPSDGTPIEWSALRGNAQGIWAYASLMPVRDPNVWITLGEGQTPLIPMSSAPQEYGLNAAYLKNEAQNPTWSHKDRLAAAAVSRALEAGANAVAVASTGNHAAATAAYAAKAGMPCYVFTTTTVPATMRTLAQVYGARVLAAETFDVRTRALETAVKEFGWWPIGNLAQPPAGSNCYGIEGYKSLAFELYEQFGHEVPSALVIPTAYGDMTYGVHKGFVELRQLGITDRLPRIVAVEPLGSLEDALLRGSRYPGEMPARDTPAFSTASPYGTQQALRAVVESGGRAFTAPDDDAIMQAQLDLGSKEGVYVEAASATALVALRELAAEGWLQPDDAVACVLTSSGLKDPGATARVLPELPVLASAELSEVATLLRKHYGVNPEG